MKCLEYQSDHWAAVIVRLSHLLSLWSSQSKIYNLARDKQRLGTNIIIIWATFRVFFYEIKRAGPDTLSTVNQSYLKVLYNYDWKSTESLLLNCNWYLSRWELQSAVHHLIGIAMHPWWQGMNPVKGLFRINPRSKISARLMRAKLKWMSNLKSRPGCIGDVAGLMAFMQETNLIHNSIDNQSTINLQAQPK